MLKVATVALPKVCLPLHSAVFPPNKRLGVAHAQAGYELFDEPQEVIDLTFGVVTLITAIIATLLGGVFIDMVGSSIRNSMLFCGWTALVGLSAGLHAPSA